MKSYDDFLADLATRESGGRCGIENQYGYLGKYQMGEPALSDIKYYSKDVTAKNDWIGTWTKESGVVDKNGFLKDCAAQDRAIDLYMKKQMSYIDKLNLNQYVGQTIGGIKITESGMLAGAHLVGVGKLKTFLTSNGRIVPIDGNKVPITTYMRKFADYDVRSSIGSPRTVQVRQIANRANSSLDLIPSLNYDH